MNQYPNCVNGERALRRETMGHMDQLMGHWRVSSEYKLAIYLLRYLLYTCYLTAFWFLPGNRSLRKVLNFLLCPGRKLPALGTDQGYIEPCRRCHTAIISNDRNWYQLGDPNQQIHKLGQ